LKKGVYEADLGYGQTITIKCKTCQDTEQENQRLREALKYGIKDGVTLEEFYFKAVAALEGKDA
jgi:hypothetical protein